MIYLFNPDHEMALAEPTNHYIAPDAIKQMSRDLSALPLWLAEGEDAILVEQHPDEEFLQSIRPLFGEKISIPRLIATGELTKDENIDLCDRKKPSMPRLLTADQLTAQELGMEVQPWGWDRTVWTRLQKLGFYRLPDKNLIQQWTQMQGRARMSEYENQLRETGLSCAVETRHFCAQSFEQLQELVEEHPILGRQGFIVKENFSSSGRGMRWCRDGRLPESWRTGITRSCCKQGGVCIEPIYHRILDFAMEFGMGSTTSSPQGSATNRHAEFLGYSLFETTESGAYLSNRLESNGQILSKLTSYVSLEALKEVEVCVARWLSQMPLLSGPVGVDMMIYQLPDGYAVQPKSNAVHSESNAVHSESNAVHSESNAVHPKSNAVHSESNTVHSESNAVHPKGCEVHPNDYAIHPNVEINFRPTMGLLARRFTDRFLAPGSRGIFVVEGSASHEALEKQHQKHSLLHPLHLSNGRIHSGYLSLTPITPLSRFRAYVLIKPDQP